MIEVPKESKTADSGVAAILYENVTHKILPIPSAERHNKSLFGVVPIRAGTNISNRVLSANIGDDEFKDKGSLEV